MVTEIPSQKSKGKRQNNGSRNGFACCNAAADAAAAAEAAAVAVGGTSMSRRSTEVLGVAVRWFSGGRQTGDGLIFISRRL